MHSLYMTWGPWRLWGLWRLHTQWAWLFFRHRYWAAGWESLFRVWCDETVWRKIDFQSISRMAWERQSFNWRAYLIGSCAAVGMENRGRQETVMGTVGGLGGLLVGECKVWIQFRHAQWGSRVKGLSRWWETWCQSSRGATKDGKMVCEKLQ